MTEPKVLFETLDTGVAVMTLNDPRNRNPMSDGAMVEAIHDTLLRVETDPDLRVLVVTGAGSTFSAGGDLKKMQAKKDMFAGSPYDVARSYSQSVQRIPLAFERLSIPVIAAINGPAMGAGCDISMMCDLRIAASSAIFGEVFVKLGLISGDGGGWFLVRHLGYQKAAEISFRGRPLDATEALELGLVLEIVNDEDLMTRALALAEEIAMQPPAAVVMTKQLLKMAQRSELKDYLATCAAMQAVAHESDEHMAALSRFLNKA